MRIPITQDDEEFKRIPTATESFVNCDPQVIFSPVNQHNKAAVTLDTESKEYIVGVNKSLDEQSVQALRVYMQVENAESKTDKFNDNEDSCYTELIQLRAGGNFNEQIVGAKIKVSS